VLFVPIAGSSHPRFANACPLFREPSRIWRRHFDVRLFRWPLEASAAASDGWQACVEAMAAELDESDHVVALWSGATLMLAATAAGAARPRSSVAVNLNVPNVTLRALGVVSIADVDEALEGVITLRTMLSGIMRRLMEGANARQLNNVTEMVIRERDEEAVASFISSYDEFHLEELPPLEGVPSLYLQVPPGQTYLPEKENQELFLRLVPGTRVKQLKDFPARLQEPEGGSELSREAIPFIEGLSAKQGSATE
jgi:hypothetical protein